MRSSQWHILLVALAAAVWQVELSADDKSHKALIQASTTEVKAAFHVIFVETIKSKDQREWRNSYAATVEILKDGKSLGKFRASTLPNFLPGRGKPKDWKYAVVQASCSFPEEMKARSYVWTRTTRADGLRPCLRLADEVPTVSISSSREAEISTAQLLSMLGEESKAKRYNRFAKNILVHSGQNQDWRGSAGCLTIHPDDAEKFFSLIPQGIKGTMELNRGIEDASTMTSYCY